MKTNKLPSFANWYQNWLCCLALMQTLFGSVIMAQGQGIITFNSATLVYATNYYELGMGFHVMIPTHGLGSPNYDGMGILSGIFSNYPTNSTPYLFYIRQFSPDDYVAFSLTNGYSFGLTSVQLADPNSPSSSLVPISFIGYLIGGTTVTNTFTTPGGGATTFLNYTFTSAFASGLTSVDILAPRWAMDNLVFGNVAPVPEPGTVSLVAIGLLVFISSKFKVRHKP
jgi:hypothetical protein